MTLSRCGRQYDFDAALKAAQARSFKSKRKWSVSSCHLGEHWHVTEGTATKTTLDPFPPAVRQLLAARDECCQRCGRAGRLEAHHRRARHMGGSKGRSHTQCACNGVLLCRRCHEFVHLNPTKARAAGWIVLQSVSLPGSVGMPPHFTGEITRHNGYRPWYPTCEGGIRFEPAA